MAWKMSLYERLDQYFKLSLEHFSHKKKDDSWRNVLHLLAMHTQSEKITHKEAESLKIKAKGYYDKRVRRLEKNIRWRTKNKLTTTKHTTAAFDASTDEYKIGAISRV